MNQDPIESQSINPMKSDIPFAFVCSGVLSTLALLTLPILVATIADQIHLNVQEIGWLASADMAGSALAALLIVLNIHRLALNKLVLAGLITVIWANALCFVAFEFWPLWWCRFFSGFGNGLVLTVCFIAMCRSADADKSFGLYAFFQVMLQIALLRVIPVFVGEYGVGLIYALFMVSALMVGAILLLRNSVSTGDLNSGFHLGQFSFPAKTALLAMACYFLAPSAVWGYLETIAEDFSLSLESTGRALSWASFAGAIGAYSVVLLSRYNRRLMFIGLGCGLSTLSLCLLVDGDGYLQYLTAASLFNFAWNFTFPFQMGVLASMGRNDGVIIVSLVVQLGSLALGPLILSGLSGQGASSINYVALLWLCIVCYILSFVLFRLSQTRFRQGANLTES